MNKTSSLPTLGQSICWTSAFYILFGLAVSVLLWFVSSASSSILFRMLGFDIPGWATGWLLLLVSIPLFALAGAVSGVIVYWPIKALVSYLHGPRKAVS